MTELTKLSERWSKLMVWRAKQAKQRFKRASGERPRVAWRCSRIAMHAAEGVTRHARTQAKVSNVVKDQLDQVHNASPPKMPPSLSGSLGVPPCFQASARACAVFEPARSSVTVLRAFGRIKGSCAVFEPAHSSVTVLRPYQCNSLFSGCPLANGTFRASTAFQP